MAISYGQVLAITGQLILLGFSKAQAQTCAEVTPEKRVDCYPEKSPLSASLCTRRKCCYIPYHTNGVDSVPWCFFPMNYSYTYVLTKFEMVSHGYEGELQLATSPTDFPPKPVPVLKLSILFESEDRLHFKITDANSSRYEVPIGVPKLHKKINSTQYTVKTSPLHEAFYLIVKRKDTNIIVFDTRIGPLLFGDQFLQISTSLSSPNVYGLGERHGQLRPDMYWHRIPFWAADHAPEYPESGNLYGDHPFYLALEPDGLSHGVFFLNSNAKEAELQSAPALTWRSIGGVMDFYIFFGPEPDKVIQQYTQVVGRPFLPPMWSLGFHLCRWGYKTANNTLSYVEKMRAARIPQDVQWNDIDYMDRKLDFTYNHIDFDTLPNLVENLHSNGQHYMMIIDPGISDQQTKGSYAPYDDAAQMKVLVADANTEQAVRGKVWPGQVVFPDFSHPDAEEYWKKQLARYHSTIPFDGVWIDMNELSNFMNGSPENCYKNNSFDYPPYVPKVTGGNLFSRTICPSSLQYLSNNYNIHSLTGLLEMKVTSEAIKQIRGKRPFVISRSTFPGAGMYGGHWTGDIRSTWEHMKLTIPAVLGFNMFGIPMVGADICGFGGDTNEELCIRWSQLGAFYPFSRNHNNLGSRPQAPVDFSEVAQEIIRKALNTRYTLLPYLYTLFYKSHLNGSSVARPLFFEFPFDEMTYDIDTQFLWGSALLISPVLEPLARNVEAYLPAGKWFSFSVEMGKPLSSTGQYFDLDAPLADIPIHIRGGSVIPCSISGTVTSEAKGFCLIAALDNNGVASGSLYWDDGDSVDSISAGKFSYIEFSSRNASLCSKLVEGSGEFADLPLAYLYVLGVQCKVDDVMVNGRPHSFSLDEFGNLRLAPDLPSIVNFVVTWFCV